MNNSQNEMAAGLDYIDELVSDDEEPHVRRKVLRNRLHPLDIYIDVDIYARLHFQREGIMRITLLPNFLYLPLPADFRIYFVCYVLRNLTFFLVCDR